MAIAVNVLGLKLQSIDFVKRGVKERVFNSRSKLYLVHLLWFVLKLCELVLCLVNPNVHLLKSLHYIGDRLSHVKMAH